MNNRATKPLLRRQQAWVLGIGVLFLADFVFYGYMPSHRRLESLARARSQHESTLNTATSQAEALPTLEKRHKETAGTVRYYEACVPTESELGVFLGQIASIMTVHQLADQVVEPGKEIEADELNCIPVRMDCTGTLSAIFGFCADLQSLHRIVRIEKITLNNDSGFTGRVAMQTEAVIFYRPQKTQETDSWTSKRFSEKAPNGA